MAQRPVGELLVPRRRRSGFASLLAHAADRESWTIALRALLPAGLAGECHVANVRAHVLTVHLTNAAWATRFRFLIPDLLPRLNRLADFASVTDIRIKVAPVGSVPAPPSDDGPQRQPPDGQALTKFADALDYGELREAILRLARQGTGRAGAQSEPGVSDGLEPDD